MDTTLSIVLKLVDEASGAMQGVGATMKSVGESITSAGRTLSTDLTLPIVGIGTVAAKAATDFQQAMILIQTQAGASAAEVQTMSAAILDMVSAGAEQTPKELADALYHIESAGLHGADALTALKAASEGAAVGQTDLEGVTNALVGAINSGIKGSSDFQGTIASLNAIVGAGNMRMADLVGALSTGILPAARSAGIGLNDVGAAIALMTSNGIPAEDAATRLRMTLSLMEAPTTQATKALQEIGLTSTQLADDMRTKGLTFAIQDLEAHLIHSGLTATEQAQVIDHAFGGGRTSSAILTLTQNADQLGTVLQRVNDGMGQFGADISAQKATDAAKFAQAQAQMSEAMIKLGAAILPLVADVLPKLVAAVTMLVDIFTKLPPHVQDGISIFLGLLALLGPLLLAIGAVISVLGTLITIFSAVGVAILALSAPILILGALIVALAVVVTTQWQNIKTGTQVLVDFLKSMWKQATDDVNAFLSVVTNSISTVMGLINSVKSAASGFASNVATGAAVVSHAIVPHLASGGIVTGPTLALIGEAGPEAVVPLSGSGGFGGGGGINITITGNNISNQLDVRSIAQAVGDEIVRTLRMNQKLAI